MEILKFEDAPAPKRAAKKRNVNSSRKTILGIAAAAAIAVVGSTLAANISINTGSGLEFGQGLTATAACSGGDAITMTPASSFTNGSSTSGTFYMSGITFGGTGLGTNDSCNGKTFTIQAWDNTSGSNALTISSLSGTGYNLATFQYATSAGGITKWSPGITAGNAGGTFNATTGYATVAFNTGTGVATSGQIYKLTLQSQ
jgi:hypothetical protein